MDFRQNKGFTVLLVMFATSIVLLAFSFWVFSRRGELTQPQQPAVSDEQIMPALLEWAGFSNTSYGISFQYPKNVFVSPQTQSVSGNSSTRVFLGTSNMGTMTVTVLSRQFDSRNIIDPTAGKITDAKAINVANTTGYQYTTLKDNCEVKAVQVPHGPSITMFGFSSCDFDQSPKLSQEDSLVLQILGSLKLTAVVPSATEESIDTLPVR